VPALAQDARPAEDGVERAAQIVRDQGDEIVFRAAGVLGFAARHALALQSPFAFRLSQFARGDLFDAAYHSTRISIGKRYYVDMHPNVAPILAPELFLANVFLLTTRQMLKSGQVLVFIIH
jgi:hypothetical protein